MRQFCICRSERESLPEERHHGLDVPAFERLAPGIALCRDLASHLGILRVTGKNDLGRQGQLLRVNGGMT